MNIKQMINTCCSYREITNKELAEKTNQAAQNLNNKLQRNDIRISELETLVSALDCHIELKIVTNDSNKTIFEN